MHKEQIPKYNHENHIIQKDFLEPILEQIDPYQTSAIKSQLKEL